MIAEAFPINDSIAIVRGVFGENILMFLQNGVNRGVYLEPFTKKGDDNVKRAIKDGNKFSISPNKKHIARITQNGGLIESYKIEDMELIKLFSHNYFEVICDNQLSDTKDSRYGYIDVSVSNNKIYALYDGGLVNRENSFCSNVIHVYSFDGELLEKLFLDFFVDSANVDCNDTIIFAKSSENNDLLSFKL